MQGPELTSEATYKTLLVFKGFPRMAKPHTKKGDPL